MAFYWMYKNGTLYGNEDDTRIEISPMTNKVRVRLYMCDEALEEYRSQTGAALLWAFDVLSKRAASEEMTKVFKLVEGTSLDDPIPF